MGGMNNKRNRNLKKYTLFKVASNSEVPYIKNYKLGIDKFTSESATNTRA